MLFVLMSCVSVYYQWVLSIQDSSLLYLVTDMVTSEPVSVASLAIQKTLPPTSVESAVNAVLQLIDDPSANRKDDESYSVTLYLIHMVIVHI